MAEKPPLLFYFNPYETRNRQLQAHSARTRYQIIAQTSMLSDCIITGRFFPLPPKFEEKRQNLLGTAQTTEKMLRKELLETFCGIEQIDAFREWFEEKCQCISAKKNEIDRLSHTISRHLRTGGRGITHFFFPQRNYILRLPYPDPSHFQRSFNCSHSLTRRRKRHPPDASCDDENYLFLSVCPYPLTYNVDKTTQTWWFEFKSEWSGKKVNAEKIKQIEETIEIEEREIDLRKSEIGDKFSEEISRNPEFECYAAQFNHLFTATKLLSNHKFGLKEIEKVINFLNMVPDEAHCNTDQDLITMLEKIHLPCEDQVFAVGPEILRRTFFELLDKTRTLVTRQSQMVLDKG
eukprot:TRINITY_DN281_c0_g1_i7.p1 TRINITY_DN281_c0_g1~~TRINITY_DN281_c0_g1_i7.p1  ORF type:complete len:349 (-),score=79.69 TRINITY_DN281_c0_g1_i7:575-1621(-)